MVKIKGPRFRSVKINSNRKLGFNPDRDLPYGKLGVTFRKQGVTFRKRGVTFGDKGVSNIQIGKKEDPVYLNNEGVKFYNKGKYKTALKFFNKAIAVAPRFEMARKNRIQCTKTIQEAREKYVEQQAQKKVSVSESLPQSRVISKGYDQSHNIDYSRQRFAELDQYGQIPKKKRPSNNNTKNLDWLDPKVRY